MIKFQWPIYKIDCDDCGTGIHLQPPLHFYEKPPERPIEMAGITSQMVREFAEANERFSGVVSLGKVDLPAGSTIKIARWSDLPPPTAPRVMT